MDSRQQFEEWASDNGKWPQAVERNGDSYKLMKTHTDWLAWQASRRSLVIDLPVVNNENWACSADQCECIRTGINMSKRAIYAAGIRTK